MPTIPYVKQGAPFIDHASDAAATFAAADANAIDNGVYEAHLQPAVRVTKAAAQTGLVTATETALTFDTERFDQAAGVADTMHDNSTNPTRLTCRYAGVYEIKGNAQWSANPVTGVLHIKLNGTTFIGESVVIGDHRVMNVSTLYALAVNDYVELFARQDSGSNKDILKTANVSPEFMMVRVG